MTTVLVTPEELARETVEVRGDVYRHLFRASRLAVGDAVRVVDGAGRARRGEVASVDRKAGVLTLGEEAPAREPERRVELFVAAPRPQRASWLVEKVTEVGVRAVHFLSTERSARSFGAGQLERLGRVAAAAVEQCGRSRLPELTGDHSLEALEPLLRGLPERFVLDPGAGRSPRGRSPEAAALLVGPEGGWSGEELALLERLGAEGLSLGPTILRVETAAVVGAGMLLLG